MVIQKTMPFHSNINRTLMYTFKITNVLGVVHILVTLVTRWHTTSSCGAVPQAKLLFEKGMQGFRAICFGKNDNRSDIQ